MDGKVAAMQPVRQLTPPEAPPLDDAALGFVRRIAGASRLCRFEEPERVCALLQVQPRAAAEAYGAALIRLMPKALGRRVVFHRPHSGAPSFDEAWLLGLLRSAREGDEDSLRFAIASRAGRQFRAPMRFLAEGLAARIDRQGDRPM